MSFATDLLDGFPMLNKRTEETLKIVGEMSKFFNTLVSCRKEYHKDLKKCLAAGQKTLLQEPELDGTVKAAFDVLITSIEGTIDGETKLTQQISDLAGEFAKFKKDNEARKKKLQSDCDTLLKDYNSQLEKCRKSRANYQSLAREAEKQQQALDKSNCDPNMKSAKIAQMNQKKKLAEEKARAAEQEYREVVNQTNAKQDTVYTSNMPAILMDFQSFEEAKIRFLQECLRTYTTSAKTQPGVFQEAADKINTAVEAIDVNADIASYVKSHATNKSCPPAIEVELYAGFDSGSGSSSSSSISISAPSTAQWGLGHADAGLSLSQKISKLEGQISKLENMIRTDEQESSAMEKMSAAYAKDPVAKKKADAELAAIKDRMNTNRGILDKLNSDLSALQSEGGGEEPAAEADSKAADQGGDAQENPVKVRGLYDYKASCDTELSFNEGDVFVVTLMDDSGWWYATIDDKQGFVPENYVEIIK